MGLLKGNEPPDPYQPGVFVHTKRVDVLPAGFRPVLYQIVGRDGDIVELEDCATEFRHERSVSDLRQFTTLDQHSV